MTIKVGTNVYAPVVAGNDTADDMAVAYTPELRGAIQHFKNAAERDAWSTAFKTRVFNTIAVLDADENGFVQAYRWDGTAEDGSDGKWVEYDLQGVVMSDSNGAIPKNIKTVVFGPGFAIQQAGDQEDAALVTYTSQGGGGGIDGITVNGNKLTEFNTMAPIQFDTGLGTGGTARMLIDPSAYETRHGNACLLKLDMVTTVAGQHPHAIYMAEEIVPTGEYFQLNPQAKGVDVQDSTGGDTAVTGGEMTEVLVKLAFVDTAPDDGNVKVWLEYKDPSDSLAKKILLDVNGKPLAVEKNFKANDSIGDFILAGAFMAKATQPLKVMVETSFEANAKITLDPVNTMLCLNQFDNGYETSIARIEFLRRAAIQITPSIQKFTNTMTALSKEINGLTIAESVISAGLGLDTLNEVGVHNLTPIKFSVGNAFLNIKDNGSTPADFYVDTLLDNTRTRMLRGKELTANITIQNPDSAFEFEAYSWNGNPDHVSTVYSTRNNNTININVGWEVIKGIFIAENPQDSARPHTLSFTVPNDANNILILVRPSTVELPTELHLSELAWGTSHNFTGYVEIERYHAREEHLRFDDTYAEYFLTNEGYQQIRYTINNSPSTGNPMPVGKLAKGKAAVEIDHTVNQVSGSAVPQFDGAIKFLADGEASISKSYNVWNETNTDNTVKFWDVLIGTDGSEDIIADSERTFTVPANTGAPGIVYTIPAYATVVETGQRIGGRATSDKADGAFVQSQNASEYLVQTVVELKELVTTVSDDPDLITDPISKALVGDNRVYTFTGNTEQNLVISLDIPADVRLSGLFVVKKVGNVTTTLKDAAAAYDDVAKTLTVHVGTNVTDGEVYMQFWGGIA